MINLFKRKNLTVLCASLFLGFFLLSTIVGVTALNLPRNNKIVVVYDKENEITTKAAKDITSIASGFDAVEMIGIDNANQLLRVIATTNNPVIYIFHGTIEEWTIGNSVISTKDLAKSIEKSPSRAHFMAVCESEYLASLITGKDFVAGLVGVTDIVWASTLVNQMLISYYQKMNLRNDIIQTQIERLNNFIVNNALKLITLLKEPVNPLWGLDDGNGNVVYVVNRYDSSYIGGTGLHSITHTESLATQIASDTFNTLLSVLGKFGVINGFECEIDWVRHYYKAKAVNTWKTSYFNRITNTFYNTWYSSYDWVEFTLTELEVEVAFDITALMDSTEDDPSGSNNGVSIGLDVELGSPSVIVGGSIEFCTAPSYTNSPASSTYTSIVNTYLSRQGLSAGWSVNLYIQLTYNWTIEVRLSGSIKYIGSISYTTTIIEVQVGGRIDFGFDSNGNIVARAGIFATASIGVDVDIAGISGEACLLLFAIKGEWNSGNFRTAGYSGFLVRLSGRLGTSRFNIGFSKTFVVSAVFWNDLGISGNDLVTEFADDVL